MPRIEIENQSKKNWIETTIDPNARKLEIHFFSLFLRRRRRRCIRVVLNYFKINKFSRTKNHSRIILHVHG